MYVIVIYDKLCTVFSLNIPHGGAFFNQLPGGGLLESGVNLESGVYLEIIRYLLREEEERSKLLFMDQSGGEDLEEEVDIWERKNGQKYYDENNGDGQQQQQIWQRRPILKVGCQVFFGTEGG
jgi:hypothetical protein